MWCPVSILLLFEKLHPQAQDAQLPVELSLLSVQGLQECSEHAQLVEDAGVHASDDLIHALPALSEILPDREEFQRSLICQRSSVGSPRPIQGARNQLVIRLPVCDISIDLLDLVLQDLDPLAKVLAGTELGGTQRPSPPGEFRAFTSRHELLESTVGIIPCHAVVPVGFVVIV